MTIKPAVTYAGRATIASAEYPGGGFKNESPAGAKNGTPVESAWRNDQLGADYALLARAGIPASGVADTALNSQVATAVIKIAWERTMPPQVTVDDLCAGGLTSQWVNPAAAPNALSTGAAIRDSALGWDLVTGRPFLLILFESGAVHKVTGLWDYSSTPVLSSEITTIGFPSTPDDIYAICADSTQLYVVWGVTTGNFLVSAFSTSDLSEVWTIDTGYEIGSHTTGEDIRIITAAYGKLAVMLPDDGFGKTYRAIGIIAKSDGAALYGTGSWASGYGDNLAQQNAKLVSDGTHVYWIQYTTDGTNRVFYLMSAAIADPTGSAYASKSLGTFVTANEYTHPRGLVRIGANIVYSSGNGSVGVFNTTDDYVYAQSFDLTNNALATTHAGGQDVIAGSDGMNLWMHFVSNDGSHGRQANVLCKLKGGRLSLLGNLGSNFAIDDGQVVVNSTTFEEDHTAGKLICDQMNMLFVKRSGVIYRIPNPGMR